MPFSDHCGLVARALEELGEGLLVAIEAGGVVVEEAVEVGVLTREDTGARGAANGVGAVGAVGKEAFFGKAIDAGGGCDVFEGAAVCGDGVDGVVVGKKEEDVRTSRRRLCLQLC